MDELLWEELSNELKMRGQIAPQSHLMLLLRWLFS